MYVHSHIRFITECNWEGKFYNFLLFNVYFFNLSSHKRKTVKQLEKLNKKKFIQFSLSVKSNEVCKDCFLYIKLHTYMRVCVRFVYFIHFIILHTIQVLLEPKWWGNCLRISFKKWFWSFLMLTFYTFHRTNVWS